MALDKLLGEEKPQGQTPLELATMADMAMEIGTREQGQPAILIYDHGDGRWPCRLGPGVSTSTLRKFGKILSAAAVTRGETESGRPGHHAPLRMPWGSILRERQFMIVPEPDGLLGEWRWLPFVLGAACGLAAAASAKFVFSILG